MGGGVREQRTTGSSGFNGELKMEQRKKVVRGRLGRDDLQGTKWVWRLGGLGARDLVRNVVADARADRIFGAAAQLSFYFLLALFPLLIFASWLAGFVLSNDQELSNRVVQYLKPVMPEAAVEFAASILQQVVSGTGHAGTSLAFMLFAIWSASYGMEAIIHGLNQVFDTKEFRSWWKRRLLAIGMTVLTALAISGVLIALVFGGSLSVWIAGWMGIEEVGKFWGYVEWGVLLLFLLLVVSLIYTRAPNLRYQPWVATLPGTAVALAIWVGAGGGVPPLREPFLRILRQHVRIGGSGGRGSAVAVHDGRGIAHRRRGERSHPVGGRERGFAGSEGIAGGEPLGVNLAPPRDLHVNGPGLSCRW
jgi:membrane protein